MKSIEKILRLQMLTAEERVEFKEQVDESDFQMCINDYVDKGELDKLFNTIIYPAMKEYAEQALKKAAEQAEVCFTKYDEETDEEVLFSSTWISDDDYKYGPNFDSLPSMQVNPDSILKIIEEL